MILIFCDISVVETDFAIRKKKMPSFLVLSAGLFDLEKLADNSDNHLCIGIKSENTTLSKYNF